MGFAVEEIAQAFSCHINTVYHWISRYEQTGNINALPRSGRRRATTPDQDINIVASRFAEPFKTAKEIYDGLDLNCSYYTVVKRMHENGFIACRAAQKELLTQQHIHNRVIFAEEYANFNGFVNGIYTDESTFMTGSPHKLLVWRQIGTRYDENNIQIVRNSGRTSVSVWGCLTREGLGPLYRVWRNFNSNQYLDVCENLIYPWLYDRYPNYDYTFIQDRSPIHTSSICREWFEENMEEQNLYLPAKSPDLNVIEHIWFIIKHKLSRRGIFNNNTELWIAIRDEWENLRNDVNLCQRLVDSVPRRMQNIIANNGGYTKY
jgi:transposase